MPKLCLNMIVKNEGARIARCLSSLAPWITAAVILDTGSTDGTPELIQAACRGAHIPHQIYHAEFVNWSQARNLALQYARASEEEFDYIFLVDADMELMVEDPKWLAQLTAVRGDLLQKQNGLAYWNARLLRRDSQCGYIGVTHEYLDCGGEQQINGAWFLDHGDGANRPGKFERDIRLLEQGLLDEPRNGRYWFYLAQSLRDAGRTEEAIDAYKHRVRLGGWDEEQWYAQWQLAKLQPAKGDFVRELLIAYNMRPQRVEPLYALAKHFRELGKTHIAMTFADLGMNAPLTTDVLFVEEFPYKWGLREEFSIAAFYNKTRQHEGFQVCDWLALDKATPAPTRELAKSNLAHYIKPLSSYLTVQHEPLPFTPEPGWKVMNPSITRYHGGLLCNARTVNYTMNEQGGYDINGGGGDIRADNPIRTRNFLVALDPDLNQFGEPKELRVPALPPLYPYVIGHEDVRLFEWKQGLYALSNVREQNRDGWCTQVLSQVDEAAECAYLSGCQELFPKHTQHEKNWMPLVDDCNLRFVYRLNMIQWSPNADLWFKPSTRYDVGALSGGTQAIPFANGWLMVVHEARVGPNGKRYYQHRFAWFNSSYEHLQLSPPFVFQDRQIEFAAGITWHPTKEHMLVISYGVRDAEAWLAVVNESGVADMMWGGEVY